MSQFEEFAELLERNCVAIWRTVIGRDDEDVLAQVNSVLFTKRDDGDVWRFSFALRRGERWCQEQVDVEPFEYDPIDVPSEFDPKRSVSPQNRASELSVSMAEAVVAKVRR